MKGLSGNSFSPLALSTCLVATLLPLRALSTATPTCTPTPNLVCVEVAWEDFNDNDDWGPGPGHARGWEQTNDQDCIEEDLGGGNYYGVVRNKVSLLLNSTGMQSLTVSYRSTRQGFSPIFGFFCYGLSVHCDGTWTDLVDYVSGNSPWSDNSFTYFVSGSDQVAVQFYVSPTYPWHKSWCGLDDIHITACYVDATPTPTATPTITPSPSPTSPTPIGTCTPTPPLTCVEVAWEDFNDNDDWGPGPGHPAGWVQGNDASCTENMGDWMDYYGVVKDEVRLLLDSTGVKSVTVSYRWTIQALSSWGSLSLESVCYGLSVKRRGTWTTMEDCVSVTENTPWCDGSFTYSVANSDEVAIHFRFQRSHSIYGFGWLGLDNIHVTACYAGTPPTPAPTPTPSGSPVPPCVGVFWDDFNDNDDWGPGAGHPNGWTVSPDENCLEDELAPDDYCGVMRTDAWARFVFDTRGMKTATVYRRDALINWNIAFSRGGYGFLRNGRWAGVGIICGGTTGFGWRDVSRTYSIPEDADQMSLSFGMASNDPNNWYGLDNVGVIGCYGEDPLTWQDIGWIEVQSSAPMAASVLYENRSNEGVAGVPANVALSKNHCLCHLHSTDQYYTGVAVANPSGCDEAHVDLTAYDASGGVLDSVSFVVPTKGKVSQLVSHPSLFGRRLGTGWMFLTSDVDVATTAMYGDRLSGGLAAAAGTEHLDTLVLPHFHCDRHWWTGLSVVNPNDVQVAIQATAYAENGRRLDVIQRTIPAKGRFEGLVDRLFKLPGDGKGWILVEATDGPVAGSVIYGRRGAMPRSIAALSAVQPSADRHLLSFRDGQGWWTGVCAVNPSDTSTATAIWRARTSSGRLIDEVTIALAPRQKLLTLVGTLFDLSEISEGWVEMEADLPIACFGVLRADETGDGSKGLVAMEPQPSALKPCIPHYDVRPVWQTHVLLGNPHDRSTRSVLWSYGNDGRLAGVVNPSISPKGRLCRHVRGLFRIPTPATRGVPLSQRRRCSPDGTLLGFREGASERAAPRKPRR